MEQNSKIMQADQQQILKKHNWYKSINVYIKKLIQQDCFHLLKQLFNIVSYLHQIILMQNQNCSLNTQQLCKKRQLFWKNRQSSTMNPQLYTELPMSNQQAQSPIKVLSSRRCQNDDYYGQKQQLIPSEEEIKTVKLTTHKSQNINQYFNTKCDSASHYLISNEKIKIPTCYQNVPLPVNSTRDTSEKGMVEELLVLKELLFHNQSRIAKIMEFVNTLYQKTIELYRNHEINLRELVNRRCYEIMNIYKSAILRLKIKDQQLLKLEQKITILINTLKCTKQSLRLTKIKQECIEVLQKKQVIKNKMVIQEKKSIGFMNNGKVMGRDSCQPGGNGELEEEVIFPSFQEFVEENHDAGKIQDKIRQVEICSAMKNLLDKSNHKCMTFTENIKKSPFETNEMLQISNPKKTLPNTPQSSTITFSQYSFGKTSQLPHRLSTQLPTNVLPLRAPQSSKTQQLKKNQTRLREALKHFNTMEVWLDNLNCLRFRNGAYVLDSDGNAFIFSCEQFSQLIQNKIIGQNVKQCMISYNN